MAAEGIYELVEATRYLRATIPDRPPTYGKMLRWVRKGLSCPKLVGAQGKELYLTFEELISLRMVVALRQSGFSLQHVTRVENYLRGLLSYEHPFAVRDLWFSGTQIFVEMEHELLSASRHGQLAMVILKSWLHALKRKTFVDKEFMDMAFERRINGKLAVSSWTPYMSVILDPRIQFGVPCIEGTRIPTRSIWFMVKGGDSEKAIASAYHIPIEKVGAALAWEQKLVE